ncbi:MAG: N-acetylmuramoyl-L-alanine amidase [Verrucomicrobiales bacterium]|nr:N-acetylmuramoyl-L-alanine amidase [Verrucomicrobiales bacterium]
MARINNTARWRPVGAALSLLLLASTAARAALSVLAETPDWRELDVYQHTLTAAEFRARLPLYSNDGALARYLTFSDRGVEIFADQDKTRKLWELRWAAAPSAVPDFPPGPAADRDRPLAGLNICLDPGHIGGDWADMEERHFRIRGGPWVDEAALNFITCQWIEQGLRAAGAEVCWTRQLGVPATPRRPADFTSPAITLMWRQDANKAARQSPGNLRKLLQWYQELVFYRIAEIQARAATVRELRPDLTLCIHYNALGWSKRGPRLYSGVNRIVIFTHGSYLASELALDDMKFDLFRKLLEHAGGTERRVADAIAEQVVAVWQYPPERYRAGLAGVAPAGRTPYVWSRNLLANRLYPGPVVFVEGPFMDDALTYRRIIAGDYAGEREIAGRNYRSIYREYADIVVRGVLAAYQKTQHH